MFSTKEEKYFPFDQSIEKIPKKYRSSIKYQLSQVLETKTVDKSRPLKSTKNITTRRNWRSLLANWTGCLFYGALGISISSRASSRASFRNKGAFRSTRRNLVSAMFRFVSKTLERVYFLR